MRSPSNTPMLQQSAGTGWQAGALLAFCDAAFRDRIYHSLTRGAGRAASHLVHAGQGGRCLRQQRVCSHLRQTPAHNCQRQSKYSVHGCKPFAAALWLQGFTCKPSREDTSSTESDEPSSLVPTYGALTAEGLRGERVVAGLGLPLRGVGPLDGCPLRGVGPLDFWPLPPREELLGSRPPLPLRTNDTKASHTLHLQMSMLLPPREELLGSLLPLPPCAGCHTTVMEVALPQPGC